MGVGRGIVGVQEREQKQTRKTKNKKTDKRIKAKCCHVWG
jgi:hypothetical protein